MIALLLAVPMMTFALWFVHAADGLGDFPAAQLALVPLALAVGAYSFCELVGFRAAPLPPGGDPAQVESQSWLAFTKSTFVRFAICDAAFLVTVPLSFIADSFWLVLIGAILALPLIAWEAWPGLRNQQRFAASLEAGGHPSYLTGRPMDRT